MNSVTTCFACKKKGWHALHLTNFCRNYFNVSSDREQLLPCSCYCSKNKHPPVVDKQGDVCRKSFKWKGQRLISGYSVEKVKWKGQRLISGYAQCDCNELIDGSINGFNQWLNGFNQWLNIICVRLGQSIIGNQYLNKETCTFRVLMNQWFNQWLN